MVAWMLKELDQERVDMGEAGATYTRVANKPVGVAHMNIYQKIDDHDVRANVPWIHSIQSIHRASLYPC